MPRPEADVLILGAGVIGLACAHYLQQAGRTVHLIDRGRVGGATSHGNCGTITPSHAPPLAAPGTITKALRWMLRPDAPFYVKPRLDLPLAAWLMQFAGRCNRETWQRTGLAKGRLLTESRDLIESLVSTYALECEFQAIGMRYVYRDEAVFRADIAGLPDLAGFGVRAEVIEGVALAHDEPALLPGLAGAIHFPGDAHLRPEMFTAELARIVRAQGGVIEEGVAIDGLEIAGGRVASVSTSDGVRCGRDILVALGPWSAPLLARHGVHLPIQPGKGYSQTYTRPSLAPRVPLVLREHSVCVTAWSSGFRLGSTMEFAGYDDSLNATRLAALERAARQYLHEPVGPERREQWYGWRPMTVDDLPILGVAPGHENLWLATGHGMMGMGMSAISGKLVSELMTGSDTCIDPAPTSPTRFR